MHAIFNEDIEDEEVEEVVEQDTPVQEPVVMQPVVLDTNVSIDNFVKKLEENPEGFKDSPIFEKAIIQKREERNQLSLKD